MNKFRIIIIIFSIITIVIALILFGRGGSPTPGQNLANVPLLKVWGTAPKQIFSAAFENYGKTTKTQIAYTEIDANSFDTKILEALASNNAPDAIITDADWIIENRNKITPPAMTTARIADFKNVFVDSVSASLILTKKIDKNSNVTPDYIIAMPLWLDPIVLFWNKDIFNAENIALPPANWEEFSTISNKIKQTDATGNVQRAGSAMGRASNIPRYKETLALLTLQQGVDSKLGFNGDKNTYSKLESAVRFYTDFNKSNFSSYTWNEKLPEPQDLFAQGKLGMMLDYMSTSKLLTVKNPHLSFNIALAPQPKGSEVPIHTAQIIAITVPAVSKNNTAAWNFATWLAGSAPAVSFLDGQTIAPARRDVLRNAKVSANSLYPIIKETSLNTRRFRDLVPAQTSAILANMLDSIADGRSTISESLTDALRRITRANKENIQ
ncbi:MAG: extracellular solute-binding protein [Patescibacteria group bacterium]